MLALARTVWEPFSWNQQELFTETSGKKEKKNIRTQTDGKFLTVLRLESGCKKTVRSKVIISMSVAAAAGAASSCNQKIMKQARKRFVDEICFRKPDGQVSLLKALLLVSAEDEAFMALQRERDHLALCMEFSLNRGEMGVEAANIDLDSFLLSGKTISEWLRSFKVLSEELSEKLMMHRNRPGSLFEDLTAVLGGGGGGVEGFCKPSSSLHLRTDYLHHAMALRQGNGVMLNIIYMEVCKHLGIEIGGISCDETFFIRPLLGKKEDNSKILEGIPNWCLEVDGTRFSSLDIGCQNFTPKLAMYSISTSKLASNRDIIGIALRMLKSLHWKASCRSCVGLHLTNPLQLEPCTKSSHYGGALLQPHDLRLATMASEKLLKLQPHDWILRRDHGLLLYHSRRYGEAVQELSICIAFAPSEEVEVLQHFVQKLHLLRIESSWNTRLPNAPFPLS